MKTTDEVVALIEDLITPLENDSGPQHTVFQRREYQVRIAARVMHCLTEQRNTVVDLPTGAGKTNVVFLVALACKEVLRSPKTKVLYVVPNRTLTGQANRAARWASPRMHRCVISERLCRNSFELMPSVMRADLIISTPGLLATCVEQRRISKQWAKEHIVLMVVDEFDELLVAEYSGDRLRARLDVDLDRLIEAVPPTPFCLMSGTVPRRTGSLLHSETEKTYAGFVGTRFDPVILSASRESLRGYLPTAHVVPRGTRDMRVQMCDKALGQRLSDTIREYECELGVRLDSDYLFDNLGGIINRRVDRIRTRGGEYIEVGSEELKLARRLLSTRQKYVFLFEDMFRDIAPKEIVVRKVVDCIPTRQTEVKWTLEDSRRDRSTFSAELGTKVNLLNEILTEHASERCVVFVRFIRLSDALAEYYSTAGGMQVFQLDGRQQRRQEILEAFSQSAGGIMLLTRDTGRRGLDIPTADLAVLYSPKADEYVVWQELSRIRSRIGAEKPSYLLHYSKTSEARRLRSLLNDIQQSERSYSLEEGLADKVEV